MPKLRELADVIRSKNAGAYQITFDVMFKDEEMFRKVKQTGVLNAALFAKLYGLPEDQCNFLVYDAGHTFKCTMLRQFVSGNVGDSDGYGAQQHVPLLDVHIPLDLPADYRRGARPSA